MFMNNNLFSCNLANNHYVDEYLKVKNQENKTAFYMAINNKNDDIIDLFLEKIKEQKIQLSYIYLFKAIRTRNPELVKKLVN